MTGHDEKSKNVGNGEEEVNVARDTFHKRKKIPHEDEKSEMGGWVGVQLTSFS